MMEEERNKETGKRLVLFNNLSAEPKNGTNQKQKFQGENCSFISTFLWLKRGKAKNKTKTSGNVRNLNNLLSNEKN